MNAPRHVLAAGAALVLAAGPATGPTPPRSLEPAVVPSLPPSDDACTDLADLHLDGVRITGAATVRPASDTAVVRVPHCRVEGVIGHETRFVAALPLEWNHRFFMGGGGGFDGQIPLEALLPANFGYAVVGGNGGHDDVAYQADWALGHPDRVLDFAHRSVHETAAVAKQLIRAYYGADPEFSYFAGCSSGGREALIEAQRYPADFDGIVSGAPAYDWSAATTALLHYMQVVYPDAGVAQPAITPANRELLSRSVMAACDTLDGVRDGILGDPRACDVPLDALAPCPGDTPAATCVTAAQRAALRELYAPTVIGGEEIYPRLLPGSAAVPGGVDFFITGNGRLRLETETWVAPSFGAAIVTETFKYLVTGDSLWDYTSYDLARAPADLAAVGELLNADSPDLDAFRDHGGKLILYHGWADPAINPVETIAYYDRVLDRRPEAARDIRLFLMPGVLHCAGGSGPDRVNWHAAIARWVEEHEAPERLSATKFDSQGEATLTRPICAYPARAVYRGNGSTDDEASFVCSDSTRS